MKQVKVLGVLAQPNEEETNRGNDPLASTINYIDEFERHPPRLLRATNEWFRVYKIPDGKPENHSLFQASFKIKSKCLCMPA